VCGALATSARKTRHAAPLLALSLLVAYARFLPLRAMPPVMLAAFAPSATALHVNAAAHARCAARSVQRCSFSRSRRAARRADVRVRADAAPAMMSGSNETLMKALGDAIAEVQQLPPSMRKEGAQDASKTVRAALQALKSQNGVALFDSYSGRTMRRNVRAPPHSVHRAPHSARTTEPVRDC
jgi:hypothetical protein